MSPLPELMAADFPAVFEAIHGQAPFPWQRTLAEQICTERCWPDQLDLPTGAGKTAALDIALFHLAVEADLKADRRAPLRIALVVDRRLVVDDAFRRARRIAKKLREAPSDTVLGRMRARLRFFAGENAPPVLAERLRGGLPMEGDWARTPSQPLLISSTVDQIGSRLLFRGYGVSDRMKPVHAGLTGSDCLILLDEAHLSEPFRQTLGWVRLHRETGWKAAAADPWDTCVLTATPAFEPMRPFRLTEVERTASPIGSEPVNGLRRRLTAKKTAELVDNVKDLTAAIAEKAIACLKQLETDIATPPAVGVVVNRVALARAVFERLCHDLQTNKPGAERRADVVLLIGPSRPLDRDELTSALKSIYTGGDRQLSRALVVVATQCLEVGVDLDFDGLVTQCAALDALRQRFGRLNRNGRAIETRAAITVDIEALSTKRRKDGDPIYGQALAETWDWLKANATEGTVDFGIEAMNALVETAKSEGKLEKLLTTPLNAPAFAPAYLDILTQTSPLPEPDIDISLFLHGPQRTSATVSLVWRADLTTDDLGDQKDARGRCVRYIEGLVHLPPRSGEILSLPVWAVKKWLSGDEGIGSLSDAAEAERGAEIGGVSERGSKRVLRWCGPDDGRTGPIEADKVRPGDVLVIPAAYGGCDRFGWAPGCTDAVTDLANAAAKHYRHRRFAFRLHPRLGDAAGPILRRRLNDFLEEHLESSAGGLIAALQDPGNELGLPVEIHNMLGTLRGKARRLRLIWRIPVRDAPLALTIAASYCLPCVKDGLADEDPSDLAYAPSSTESDDQSITAAASVDLDAHSGLVELIARASAGSLGLPQELVDDIASAGYLHDAGKIDERFQAWLAGGSIWNRDETRILAKSALVGVNTARPQELPERWRHEALSVRLAQVHPRFAKSHDPALVLYLIGTHHGYGRPWFPHADPLDREARVLRAVTLQVQNWPLGSGVHGPQTALFDFDGYDWAGLVDALRGRYGPWRLALFETVLRLADHRASSGVDGGTNSAASALSTAEPSP